MFILLPAGDLFCWMMSQYAEREYFTPKGRNCHPVAFSLSGFHLLVWPAFSPKTEKG